MIMTTGKERYQAWMQRQRENRERREKREQGRLNSFSPAELAYAAGIIDGEGTIGIRPRRDRRTYSIGVRVAMCEWEAIAFLYQRFGGHINQVKRRDRDRHRLQITWGLAARQAARFCELILPYLLVKNRQAANALELQSINTAIRNDTTLQRKQRRQDGFGPAAKGRYEINARLLARCNELHLDQAILNRLGNHDSITAPATKAAINIKAGIETPEPPKKTPLGAPGKVA